MWVYVKYLSYVQIRDDVLDTSPSEVEIPFLEANNSCRAMLIHPTKVGQIIQNGNAPLMPAGAFAWFILFLIQLI